jgi:hypothetical protein
MDNQPISFKTALSGFSKEDVINYIEQLNSKYRKMESAYNQEIEKIKKDSIVTSLPDYEKTINELKAENKSLQKQLEELKNAPKPEITSDAYREKAELYDKMSGQLGSMIIMANEKADEIVTVANKKLDSAKQDVNVRIESLNNQLYNEFVLAVESYMDEINEVNKSMNTVLDTLNSKTEESKERFEKKALKLKQALLKEVNNLTLFVNESDYEQL